MPDIPNGVKDDINQPDDPVEADAEPASDIAAETDATEPAGESSQEETAFIQSAIVDSFGHRLLTPISKHLDIELPLKRIQTAAGRLEECSFASSSHRYGATLFAHARVVYVFVQYHLIAQLQELSLQRLTQALRHIDCTQDHAVSDVTPLIGYVYQNTISHDSAKEPIRKLVSQFAAIHYTDLLKGEFEEFFSKGGDFTSDVARKLSRRLAVSGRTTKTLEQEMKDVEDQIRRLKQAAEDRDRRITDLRHVLTERQISERGGWQKSEEEKLMMKLMRLQYSLHFDRLHSSSRYGEVSKLRGA